MLPLQQGKRRPGEAPTLPSGAEQCLIRARHAVAAPGPVAWLGSLLGLPEGCSLALVFLLLGGTGPTQTSQLLEGPPEASAALL